jgi:hypothetical protein
MWIAMITMRAHLTAVTLLLDVPTLPSCAMPTVFVPQTVVMQRQAAYTHLLIVMMTMYVPLTVAAL